MFGSIKPNDQSIEEPLSNNNNELSEQVIVKDPWDDTSLIQFWHNSIGSYKVKHDKSLEPTSKRDPLQEKLDQSMKHKLSTTESELTNQKRQKLKHKDQSITSTIKSKSTVNDKTSIETIENNEEVQLDDEYDNDQQQEVDDDNDEVAENEYDENQDYHDYYQNYYSNGHYYQQYPYPSQPTMTFPPPSSTMPFPPPPSNMPFPPPPPPMPGVSSSSYPMQQQNDNELLTNLIMAWYYSGYYTGLYQAQQR